MQSINDYHVDTYYITHGSSSSSGYCNEIEYATKDPEIDYFVPYNPLSPEKLNNYKEEEEDDPEEALFLRKQKHNERERQLYIKISNIEDKERELDERETELNKKEIELLFRERCVIEKEERDQYEDEVIIYKGFNNEGTYNRRTGKKVDVIIEEKQTINKPVSINEKYMKLLPKRKVYNKSQYYMSLLPKNKN